MIVTGSDGVSAQVHDQRPLRLPGARRLGARRPGLPDPAPWSTDAGDAGNDEYKAEGELTMLLGDAALSLGTASSCPTTLLGREGAVRAFVARRLQSQHSAA